MSDGGLQNIVLDADKIYLPAPDQTDTCGAIAVAPYGTDLPVTASERLSDAYSSGGYVGDAGITVSTNKGETVIKEWGQSTVRKALSDFTGTVTCPFLQIDQFAAERLVGKQNVETVNATADHGNMLKIKLTPTFADIESYIFSMKDGDNRIRVIIPRGQITTTDTVNFVPNAANTWNGTISCYDDPKSGYAIMVIYEDGTRVVAKSGKTAPEDKGE